MCIARHLSSWYFLDPYTARRVFPLICDLLEYSGVVSQLASDELEQRGSTQNSTVYKRQAAEGIRMCGELLRESATLLFSFSGISSFSGFFIDFQTVGVLRLLDMATGIAH